MTVKWEKNMEKAKSLIKESGLFYDGAYAVKWQNYDIFFAESEKGKKDGPGLLVDGERFKWVEYSSKEWREMWEALIPPME